MAGYLLLTGSIQLQGLLGYPFLLNRVSSWAEMPGGQP